MYVSYYNKGSYYEGFFSKNIFNGYGIYYSDEYIYKGWWKDGSWNGKGECTKFIPSSKQIIIYNGNWYNSQLHGQAIIISTTANNSNSSSQFPIHMERGDWKYGSKIIKQQGMGSKEYHSKFGLVVDLNDTKNNVPTLPPKMIQPFPMLDDLKQRAMYRRSFHFFRSRNKHDHPCKR